MLSCVVCIIVCMKMAKLHKRSGDERRRKSKLSSSSSSLSSDSDGENKRLIEEKSVEKKEKEHSVIYTMTLITVVVASPYVVYMTYLFLHLQSGLLGTVVSPNAMRQVLIVGPQSRYDIDFNVLTHTCSNVLSLLL